MADADLQIRYVYPEPRAELPYEMRIVSPNSHEKGPDPFSLDPFSLTEADPASGARALHETLSLARAYRISAYDAAYLELAMRLGLPLATGDRALAAAASRAGVAFLSDGVW